MSRRNRCCASSESLLAETPLPLGGHLALRNLTNGEVAEALNLRPARAQTGWRTS